jgi:hypothetical protein
MYFKNGTATLEFNGFSAGNVTSQSRFAAHELAFMAAGVSARLTPALQPYLTLTNASVFMTPVASPFATGGQPSGSAQSAYAVNVNLSTGAIHDVPLCTAYCTVYSRLQGLSNTAVLAGAGVVAGNLVVINDMTYQMGSPGVAVSGDVGFIAGTTRVKFTLMSVGNISEKGEFYPKVDVGAVGLGTTTSTTALYNTNPYMTAASTSFSVTYGIFQVSAKPGTSRAELLRISHLGQVRGSHNPDSSGTGSTTSALPTHTPGGDDAAYYRESASKTLSFSTEGSGVRGFSEMSIRETPNSLDALYAMDIKATVTGELMDPTEPLLAIVADGFGSGDQSVGKCTGVYYRYSIRTTLDEGATTGTQVTSLDHLIGKDMVNDVF